MIYDKFHGLHKQFWGWKCLICGEIGDPVYGRGGGGGGIAGFGRQALHAWRLGLNHPADGRPVSWTSMIPADLFQLLEQCQVDASALPEVSA